MMVSRLCRWAVLAASVAAVAAAAAPAWSGPKLSQARSVEVFPEQSIPLSFSHRRHLESGIQCILCHDSVRESVDVRDRNLPGHAVCGICHQMDSPEAADLFPKSDCAACHVGHKGGVPEHLDEARQPLPDAPKPKRVELPHAHLKFSHKLHLDQGVVCLECHESVPDVDLATRDQLPEMGTCLACHDGGRAPSDCRTCHLQDDTGRLDPWPGDRGVLKPRGRFRPDNHRNEFWSQQHQAAALMTPEACSSCHAPSECLDCHDGTTKPLDLHPADWIMSHGLEANRRSMECAACHDNETFCQDCHTQAQVVPGAFPGVQADPPGNRRFHPEGWRGEVGEIAGAAHHSHEARRSLASCTSCHGQEQCVDCHSFVNPHPRSWSEPGAAGKYAVGDGVVCLSCHSPSDPLLEGVRR